MGEPGKHTFRDQHASRALTTAEPWEPPAPMGTSGTLPGFPTGILPGWLAEFVTAEAIATQTPDDLAGLLSLAVLGVTAGGLAQVQIRPGWAEPLNLFITVAMPPAARKSAVFAAATAPLASFDQAETLRMQAVIIEAITAKKVAEKAADQAQSIAGKASPEQSASALAEAIAAESRAAAILVPPAPRLLADDTTPEAVAGLLADHGRLGLLSPEGDVFELMAGRYSSGGPNLGVYLRAHAGDTIRIDRRGRPPEFCARPALTIGLAVQPVTLRAVADKPGMRGRGLLARFLYGLPVNTVGRRKIGAPPVPAGITETYQTRVQTLARSLRDAAEAGELAGSSEPMTLRLGADAAALLTAFERDLEPRLDPDGGDLAAIGDWAGKLAGATARIAGLLHLAGHLPGSSDTISGETMSGALSIANYLIPHAVAAFGLMGADPALEAARYVLGRIEQRDLESFTRRELFRAVGRGYFAKVTDLDPVLELLTEHGYIRVIDTGQPPGSKGGRPPSPRYETNPLWVLTELTELTQPLSG